MTDPATSPTKGACVDCGARFRIPDASRTYPCKKCGGEVRALGLQDQLEELVECPACGADNEPDAKFCEACGEPLSAAAKKAAKADRRAASADLRRAQKRIRTLKFLFRTFGVLALIVFLFMLAAAIKMGSEVEIGGETVSTGVYWILTLIQGGVAALLLVASARIDRSPFFWALIIAALQTVNVAVSVLAAAPNPVSVVLAVVYWLGVAAVAPVERLIEEHPDLAASRRFRGEIQKRSGTVRERKKPRTDWGPRLIAIGGVTLLGVLSWAGFAYSSRVPAVDGVLDRFVSDWRTDGLRGLSGYYEPDRRPSMAEAYEDVVAVRGWKLRAPQPGLELERSESASGSVVVRYTFGDGEAETTWSFDEDDREWYLRRLKLPRGDFVERLVETWNGGDLDALARFFNDPVKGRASLDKMMGRRDWTRLPRITDRETESRSGTRLYVHGETDQGPVRLAVQQRPERWALSSIKPPARESD